MFKLFLELKRLIKNKNKKGGMLSDFEIRKCLGVKY